MRRIFFLIVLLIIYGSLYPWQFHPKQIPGNPLWILAHSWPAHFDRFILKDIGVNILLYIPLGMFGYLAFGSVAWTLALGVALSASLEMVQLYDARRVCSALDLTLNTVGLGSGIFLSVIARRWILPGVDWALRPSGALFLIYVWIGYLAFPFFPDFSRTSLNGKLRAIQAPASIPMLTAFAEWLALAKLAEALVGGSAWAVVLWTMVIAIGKLLIRTRTVTSSELVGAAAALILWAAVLRRRDWPAAALFLTILVIAGLAPFNFTAAPHFSWIPFRAFFMTNWEEGSVVFLQKSFLYGAAIWLLQQAGWSLRSAAACTITLLAAIEAAQIYLPGRVAESTDPLMAAGLALIFHAFERTKIRTAT